METNRRADLWETLGSCEQPQHDLLRWAFTGLLAVTLYRIVTMLPIECPEPLSGWRGSVLLLGCCSALAWLSAQLISWANDLTGEQRWVFGLCCGLCATMLLLVSLDHFLAPRYQNHWPLPLYGLSVWGPIWLLGFSGLGRRPAASTEEPLPKIVELVHFILMGAIVRDADYIRIERRQDGGQVALKIDGVFLDYLMLSVELHEPVVRRIKLKAGIRFADPRVPQKGRFGIAAVINERPGEFEFLVSSVPTESGEGVLLQRTESHWAPSGRSGSTAPEQADAEPSLGVGSRVLGERVVLFRKRPRRRRTVRLN